MRDDRTQVTLDWLLTLGGTLGKAPAGNLYVDFLAGEWVVVRLHDPETQGSDGWVPVDVFARDDIGKGVGLTGRELTTRGEIRALLDILGVDYPASHGVCSACGHPNKPDGTCSRAECCNSD